MPNIAIIGAGITGVTTAYSLRQRGLEVEVFERHRYAAMETSYANGGQLSASNAEVWNSRSTVSKGLRWILKNDAPFLMNLSPSWHKYSWICEFLKQIPKYKENTIETVRLSIAAREHLFSIAKHEDIDFDLEERGILHVYSSRADYEAASKANDLMVSGGLDRVSVSPEEIKNLEPALFGDFYGGFYTKSDSTGDIHKFTQGLAKACIKNGVIFHYNTNVQSIRKEKSGKINLGWCKDVRKSESTFDAVVICAGVDSRAFSISLGDRVNIYPIKGYSVTVCLDDKISQDSAPWMGIVDDGAKIVTSRLGKNKFRVAGTAEINGFNRDIRNDRIIPLIEWINNYFPDVSTSNVIPWAGLRPMSPSMLPRVGRGEQEGIFYNTGHGHLGWTLSTITSEITANSVVSELKI